MEAMEFDGVKRETEKVFFLDKEQKRDQRLAPKDVESSDGNHEVTRPTETLGIHWPGGQVEGAVRDRMMLTSCL